MTPSSAPSKTIIGPAAGAITTRDDLDQALLAIGQAEIRLDILKAELDAEINAVKARYEGEIKTTLATIEQKAAAISAVAQIKRAAWFDGKQSLKLLFGTVLFRKSTAIEFDAPESSIIAAIKDHFKTGNAWRDYIKSSESIVKSALAKIPDQLFSSLSLRREDRETVAYKTNREEIEKALKDRSS